MRSGPKEAVKGWPISMQYSKLRKITWYSPGLARQYWTRIEWSEETIQLSARGTAGPRISTQSAGNISRAFMFLICKVKVSSAPTMALISIKWKKNSNVSTYRRGRNLEYARSRECSISGWEFVCPMSEFWQLFLDVRTVSFFSVFDPS